MLMKENRIAFYLTAFLLLPSMHRGDLLPPGQFPSYFGLKSSLRKCLLAPFYPSSTIWPFHILGFHGITIAAPYVTEFLQDLGFT